MALEKTRLFALSTNLRQYIAQHMVISANPAAVDSLSNAFPPLRSIWRVHAPNMNPFAEDSCRNCHASSWRRTLKIIGASNKDGVDTVPWYRQVFYSVLDHQGLFQSVDDRLELVKKLQGSACIANHVG